MRYVLDTHVWIWLLSGDKRLKSTVRKLFQKESNHFILPSVCLWEAEMLGNRNRVSMLPNPRSWIEQALEEFQVEDAPFTRPIASAVCSLKFDHSDPIDQFIAATAWTLKAPLITADKNLNRLEWLETVQAG